MEETVAIHDDHHHNDDEEASTLSSDLDEISVLKAGDEDYDEDELVGDEDERVDEDVEELEVLDQPDEGLHP